MKYFKRLLVFGGAGLSLLAYILLLLNLVFGLALAALSMGAALSLGGFLLGSTWLEKPTEEAYEAPATGTRRKSVRADFQYGGALLIVSLLALILGGVLFWRLAVVHAGSLYWPVFGPAALYALVAALVMYINRDGWGSDTQR